MPRPSPTPPALVLAAQELEAELKRCEEAVADAAGTRLNSEKHLARAGRALQVEAEHREGLGLKVAALLAAIKEAQGRAESAAARMEEIAAGIQARVERLKALQVRVDAFASDVRVVTQLAKDGAERAKIVERLGPVEERVAEAQKEARAEEFDDVAHAIDGMRQMLAALRKKLRPA